MTPLNAKLLLRALQDNLAKYEERFGEVRVPNDAGFEAPERQHRVQTLAPPARATCSPATQANSGWEPPNIRTTETPRALSFVAVSVFSVPPWLSSGQTLYARPYGAQAPARPPTPGA